MITGVAVAMVADAPTIAFALRFQWLEYPASLTYQVATIKSKCLEGNLHQCQETPTTRVVEL